MKYVFFGSPEFAKIVLEKLISGKYIPAAVVCNPDRPSGRKKIITPPTIKARIMNYELGIREGIQILQPEKLDQEFLDKLCDLKPDLFIIAAYSKIVPNELINIPRLGTIGVHPSLLPKFRGASPIQNVILSGDVKTGVALFQMDDKMDHGAILEMGEMDINEPNFPVSKYYYTELTAKLAELGGNALIKILPDFLEGKIKSIVQNESQATYIKKFKTEDAFVDFNNLEKAMMEGGQIAIEILRKIRGLNPEPGVWTLTNTAYENTKIYEITKIKAQPNTRIKLLEADLDTEGKLKLRKIQFEGRKETICK